MTDTTQHAEARRLVDAAKYKLRQAIRQLGQRGFCPADYLLASAEDAIETALSHIHEARRALLACGDDRASSPRERSA